jgi:glycosyltransferase involved in cell wall biosynthesis
MKIAFICRRYYPEIGGIETHIKEIAERLSGKHEVVVFTLVRDKRQVGNEIINRVAVRRFKSLGMSYSAEIPPKSLLSEVEKFNPDIVHSHSAHTPIPYFASKIKSNSRFVITPHYQGTATTTFRRILFMAYKPLLKATLSKADRIICVSAAERDMLLDVFKLDRQQLRVVSNGVGSDLASIIPENGWQHELRILSVGRLDLHHKKTDKVIKAFKILQSKIDSRLIIVGNGPDKEEIKQIIKALDLDEKVELKSNLTREELVKEYAKASVFVTASEKEAFGIAVAEALASKLRVVVPNSTALASFVKGGYALGVEIPVTPEKLAEVIIDCIQNKRESKEYFPYTWDMATRDLESIYEGLGEKILA